LSAQVADWLAVQIEAGAYRPGDALPSEKWLMDAFGVSRPVVRIAARLLREAGLAMTVPKRGTYVADPLRPVRAAAADTTIWVATGE